MNTNYYPTYPNIGTNNVQLTQAGGIASNPSQNTSNISNPVISGMQANNNMLTLEQSYIENILRLNRGKLATFYMSFPDSVDWRDKTFTGIIEAAGRDHIIISDPKSGKWYLLEIIYLNYVEFEEKINYSPDYYLN